MPLQVVYDGILIYAVFFFRGKGETMKWTLSACLFVMICGGAHAHDFKMRVGQDTYVFDYVFYGKTINVYKLRADEPYSDRTEFIAHDWFALEDINCQQFRMRCQASNPRHRLQSEGQVTLAQMHSRRFTMASAIWS